MIRRLSRWVSCVFCLSTALFTTALVQIKNPGLALYLPAPDELGTWHQLDSAALYTGDELFTLIDGGADIYLEYGFKGVIAAEYSNDLESSVKLEIYEMSDDAAAFGMFSINRSTKGKKAEIGTEGLFNEYYMTFWKNTHLVFLTASDTAKETIAGMIKIAALIDRRLGASGIEPGMVHYLPKSGLVSCSYVRGLLGLSSQYIFDSRNIFEVKEGVIGNYRTHRLFVFNYESEEKAVDVYKKVREILKTGGRFTNFKDGNTRYFITDQKGQNISVERHKDLICVLIAKDKKVLDEIGDSLPSLLQSIDSCHSK